MKLLLWLLLPIGWVGCLDPQVSDGPALSSDILPANSTVPKANEDLRLGARIAARDNLRGNLPRRSAFGAGGPIKVWDFGVAGTKAAPLYRLVRLAPDGTEVPLPHPPIVAVAPGDTTYTQFWAPWTVRVTAAYANQRITSIAALESAFAAGLIEAPKPPSKPIGTAVVIVGADVNLDVGAASPLPPNAALYYDGFELAAYQLGDVPLKTDNVVVVTAQRFTIRRQGEEILSEIVRGIDITGDGDKLDTNEIYGSITSAGVTTSAVTAVDIVVPSTVASIDTAHDDTMAQLRTDTDVFKMGAPVSANVVAATVGTEVRNIYIQRQPGAL